MRRRARQVPSEQAGALVGTPSVDLLSSWVREERRVRALRVRFGYATLVLVLLVGMGWAGQQMRLAGVRQQLAAERAAGDQLGQRIAALDPVQGYVAAVRLRADRVRSTMYAEVSTARVLTALRDALPAGARLDSVTLELPGPGAAAPTDGTPAGAAGADAADPDGPGRGVSATCPGPDPFRTLTMVGCVALVGSAPDRRTVAALVQALARDGLFVEPFVSTTTVSEDEPVTFTGSVGLTPKAFTRRYDEVAGLQLTPAGAEALR